MNLKNAIQIYLKWKRSHTTVAYKRYKIRLDKFAKFIRETDKHLLSEINGDDVVDYHQTMEQSGYSDATIAYSARILRNFFWFWHGRGETKFNPKEIISVRYVSAEKEIIDEEDFEILNDLLGMETLPDLQKKLVINLLWDTGMRISELLDMKLSNISKQGSNGLRSAKVRTRKSMRYDQVVWGEETNTILNNYLGIRLCMETDSEYLFINPKTKKPFTARSVQRWMNALCEEAMIDKNYTPHSFRHGKANKILETGGNMRDVSVILRHVNPESSFEYTHLCEKKHQKLAGKFMDREKPQENSSTISELKEGTMVRLDSSLIKALQIRELLLQAS